MSCRERVCDLNGQIENVAELERVSLDYAPQSFALDVLHDDETDVVVLADLVDCADVWVFQPSCRLCFSDESLLGLIIGG